MLQATFPLSISLALWLLSLVVALIVRDHNSGACVEPLRSATIQS
jgi:hypothetical protein